jgi:hypothetical protein
VVGLAEITPSAPEDLVGRVDGLPASEFWPPCGFRSASDWLADDAPHKKSDHARSSATSSLDHVDEPSVQGSATARWLRKIARGLRGEGFGEEGEVSEAIHLSVAEPVAAMRPPGAVIERGRKAEVGTETAGVSRGVQAGRHRAFERSFERRALLLARVICCKVATAKSLMRRVKPARDLTRLSHSHIAHAGPKTGPRRAADFRQIRQLRKSARRARDRGCYISLSQTLGPSGRMAATIVIGLPVKTSAIAGCWMQNERCG